MFLVRTAFWLLLVLAFLPIERPSPDDTASFSAVDAFFAARSTISDMAGFCDRNPDACETGIETARVIGDRAQTGAVAVYRYFTGDVETAMERPARDTLTESDREPRWSGPSV